VCEWLVRLVLLVLVLSCEFLRALKWRHPSLILESFHHPNGMQPSLILESFHHPNGMQPFSIPFIISFLFLHLFLPLSFHSIHKHVLILLHYVYSVFTCCFCFPYVISHHILSSSSPYNCIFLLPLWNEPSHLLNHLVKLMSNGDFP